MGFPRGFVWGAAAASYQIEGAAAEDGKGPSVWDAFAKTPGKIWQGHTGDVACDHYHRYADDVKLMKALGLMAYRLSISWPRLLPDGTGTLNQRGLAFYDRLVDALLEAGIEPYVTLFHWDYPLALHDRGGWANADSPRWFAEYVAAVVQRLGDRVTRWITLNEPQVFVGIAHHEGRHAPGLKLPWKELVPIAHNVLLAHGHAVCAIRAHSPRPCTIGYAPVGVVKMPASGVAADIDAARRHMFSISQKTMWSNTWWMDPIFLGKYPDDGLRIFRDDLPELGADDFDIITSPIDFLGVNIYNGAYTQTGDNGALEDAPQPVGFPITAFDWPVTPEALYWGPKFLHERYGKPIVITENGLSLRDWVALDGKVHDPQRIDFTTRYLRELGRAIDDGAHVEGYFHWSILDNFEWAQGYKERFGLVFVDYASGSRIVKDSGHWYAEVIASNGAHIFDS